MKKHLLSTCTLLMALTTTNAQKIYLKVGGGYMAPIAGQTTSVSNWPYNGKVNYSASTGKLASFDVKNASFAAGTQLNAGFGLNVGKHAAFELNAIIGIKPKSFSGTESYPIDGNTYNSETYTLSAATPVLLNPAVVLKTEGPVKLYTRIGLLIPLMAKLKGEFEGAISQTGYLPGKYSGKQDYETNFSLGATGSVGLSVNLLKGFNLWAEGTFSSLSLSLKKRTYTEYIVNGENKLSGIPAETKEVTFTSKGGSGSLPTSTLPFSSMGISVGLSFDL